MRSGFPARADDGGRPPAVVRFLSFLTASVSGRLGVSDGHCHRIVALRTVELVDRKEEIRACAVRKWRSSPG
ncbi:hypothetical protein AHiyo4_45730 [Arthrobacter sp. Hiyo4]|nr:hypothetical protein AHiyo4_45730 [Arthrobacter sp. Hiyo4]